MTKPLYNDILSKTLIVIPTYNNQSTLATVINDALKVGTQVMVVNDGATDDTSNILKSFGIKIQVLDNGENKGKGYSLRRAMAEGLKQGFDYMISMDSDGQHFADDIPSFINEIVENGDALIVGARDMESDNVPGKSSFGYKFSNFWYWAETGEKLEDTQSGFRLYPIRKMQGIRFFTNRFEFEVEVLVRCQWNDIKVKTIPIKIFYAEGDKRISHFRPSTDFTRISILNTVLFSIAMLWIHPRNLYRYFRDNNFWDIIKKIFTENNESPSQVANAVGFGIFMGIVPIWGFQMITATFLAHRMKLNKALVLLASNISIPPVVPFLIYFGYQTGYFIYNRDFDTLENITRVTNQLLDGGLWTSLSSLGQSFLFYFGGSFIFAAMAGAVAWMLTHLVFYIKSLVR